MAVWLQAVVLSGTGLRKISFANTPCTATLGASLHITPKWTQISFAIKIFHLLFPYTPSNRSPCWPWVDHRSQMDEVSLIQSRSTLEIRFPGNQNHQNSNCKTAITNTVEGENIQLEHKICSVSRNLWCTKLFLQVLRCCLPEWKKQSKQNPEVQLPGTKPLILWWKWKRTGTSGGCRSPQTVELMNRQSCDNYLL